MLGVMRLILAREAGSASGEDDFFSVARTMPLVAAGRASRQPVAMRSGTRSRGRGKKTCL